MKKFIIMFLLVAIIIVATSAFWLTFQKMILRAKNIQQRSGVYEPLKNIISDLQKISKEGNNELLKRKIELLKNKWESFLEGGVTPEIFEYEIKNLK